MKHVHTLAGVEADSHLQDNVQYLPMFQPSQAWWCTTLTPAPEAEAVGVGGQSVDLQDRVPGQLGYTVRPYLRNK